MKNINLISIFFFIFNFVGASSLEATQFFKSDILNKPDVVSSYVVLDQNRPNNYQARDLYLSEGFFQYPALHQHYRLDTGDIEDNSFQIDNQKNIHMAWAKTQHFDNGVPVGSFEYAELMKGNFSNVLVRENIYKALTGSRGLASDLELAENNGQQNPIVAILHTDYSGSGVHEILQLGIRQSANNWRIIPLWDSVNAQGNFYPSVELSLKHIINPSTGQKVTVGGSVAVNLSTCTIISCNSNLYIVDFDMATFTPNMTSVSAAHYVAPTFGGLHTITLGENAATFFTVGSSPEGIYRVFKSGSWLPPVYVARQGNDYDSYTSTLSGGTLSYIVASEQGSNNNFELNYYLFANNGFFGKFPIASTQPGSGESFLNVAVDGSSPVTSLLPGAVLVFRNISANSQSLEVFRYNATSWQKMTLRAFLGSSFSIEEPNVKIYK